MICGFCHGRTRKKKVKRQHWLRGKLYKAGWCNYDAAALFFGLIVWRVFMEHDEAWSFGRYRLNNVPIRGLTYFRINP